MYTFENKTKKAWFYRKVYKFISFFGQAIDTFYTKFWFNPLPPSDAVRQQKNIFYRLFSVQYCHNLKRYRPHENLKLKFFGIIRSLKLRSIMGKIILISPKLDFTLNSLGCYELKWKFHTYIFFNYLANFKSASKMVESESFVGPPIILLKAR